MQAPTPSLALLALLSMGMADAQPPQRYFPGDLGQDGRISLTPVIARDGSRLYFAQSECADIGMCPQRLKVAERSGQGWSAPRAVTLPGDARVDWPSLSPDETQLLFSWAPARGDRGPDVDFDLYRLQLTPTGTGPQRIEGVDLNRVRDGAVRRLRFVHNETQPLLTAAGELYFWTERLDGAGGRDVYRVAPDGQGAYGRPELLPAPVNTRFDDSIGWIADNAGMMLLSSTRPGGLGESDLYVVRCQSGRWMPPQHLGEAANSRWNDFGPRLSPDGADLLFSSTRPFDDQAAGLIQIWSIPVAQVPVLARPLQHADDAERGCHGD